MKTNAHFLLSALAALLLPLSTLADAPTVSNLTARQRYPWNGLVDISFSLSGPKSVCRIVVVATNAATGAAVPVRSLRDKAGNAVEECTEFASGNISLVWDAETDAPETLIEALELSVVVDHSRSGVQLWEGGPYWAETNIGADEPHEYGLYFWWGDTVGYRRENNAWVATDGSSSNFSFEKGNTPTFGKNNATLGSQGWITADDVLAPANDAAHVHWSGSWRMPTDQELLALTQNCAWSWTTRNGVVGYEVRGGGDFADASIFLPCAGYGYGTSLLLADSYGFYWSSVPESAGSYSYYADVLSFNTDFPNTSYFDRDYGRSVRPVQGFVH